MNWGGETSPCPCIPRNERNLPRIRSLLHVAPISQTDQPQRIERKLLAQAVRTDGQSPSHSRCVARFLSSYKNHSLVPIAQQTVNGRELSLPGNLRRTVQFRSPDWRFSIAPHFRFVRILQ